MQITRRLFFPAVLVFSMLPAAGLWARSNTPEIHEARELISRLEEPDAPGCVVGVLDVTSGAWIYQDAYGFADLEKRISNTPELIFGIASVTKQFTAAAVAIAAQQGYFSLDDDIRDHLPEMPDYGTPITIRNLVYHTNGLRDIISLILLTGKTSAYHSQGSRIRLLARQLATNFLPGTEYRYGNSDYLLLSEIIERTTKRPFADYVDAVIFQPLDMNETYFGAHSRGREGRALPYSRHAEGWRSDDERLFAGFGTAGLMTTLDDYGKWITNLLADESKLAGGVALTRMLRSPGELRDGSSISYGFGLGFETYRGLEVISHGGSAYGYKAPTFIFPERGLGFFGFCNHGSYAQPMVMRLADIFLGFASEKAKDARESIVRLQPAQFRKFEGTYREVSLGLPMIVEARENGLSIAGGELPYLFKPVSENRFRNREKHVIEFTGEIEGRPRYLEQRERRIYGTGVFERITVVARSKEQLTEYSGV